MEINKAVKSKSSKEKFQFAGQLHYVYLFHFRFHFSLLCQSLTEAMQSSLVWEDFSQWTVRLLKQQARRTMKPGQANALYERGYLVASEVQRLRAKWILSGALFPSSTQHSSPALLPLGWQDDEEDDGACSPSVYRAACRKSPSGCQMTPRSRSTFSAHWLDSLKDSLLWFPFAVFCCWRKEVCIILDEKERERFKHFALMKTIAT